MTTRREFIKASAAVATALSLPAVSSAGAVEPLHAAENETRWLSGYITLYDPGHQAVISGDISFLSDGVSRAEIILKNSDTNEEHRLVFTGPNAWGGNEHPHRLDARTLQIDGSPDLVKSQP
jgi:hypothetical protein